MNDVTERLAGGTRADRLLVEAVTGGPRPIPFLS
jgi:hypothetical protein